MRRKNGQAFGFGLRIRLNRLRRGLWRERCEACGGRMPLDGTGISETIGLLHPVYHPRCYLDAQEKLYGKQPGAA